MKAPARRHGKKFSVGALTVTLRVVCTYIARGSVYVVVDTPRGPVCCEYAVDDLVGRPKR